MTSNNYPLVEEFKYWKIVKVEMTNSIEWTSFKYPDNKWFLRALQYAQITPYFTSNGRGALEWQ